MLTKITIRNFKRFGEAEIALGNPVVLIGPNNSGKTYASVLAHSVISACADLSAVARSGDWAEALLESGEFKGLSARAARLAASANGGGGAAVPRDLSAKIHDSTAGRLFGESLLSLIRHNFGSPLGGLVRAGSKSSRIKIGGPIRADVSISRAGATAVRVARGNTRPPGLAPVAAGNGRGGRRPHPGGSPGGRGPAALLDLAAKIAGDASMGVPPGTSHYIPAARSGVMCAHEAIAPGILDDLRRGGSRTAGTVSDLAGSLARAPESPRNGGPGIAGRIIPDVFGGRLDAGGRDALSYSRAGLSVPMHMSSSGIVGTAPLALAVSAMGAGDTLVVEEPEAHLHPQSQVRLARKMVSLVRQGMRVILSTHSLLLLEQLSIHVQLGGIAPTKRVAMGYGREDYVLPYEVAPYAFGGSAEKGHTISEIAHSADTGIPQDALMGAVESMSKDEDRLHYARGGE